MNAASERLKKALQSVAMQTATVGLISNVDASNHSSPNEFRDLLARQLVSPVRWEESLRNIIAAGADQFYEVGSGRVLAGTLKRVDRKAACECIGD
jgi:[acyl-carrier-protein] S-malonyltransferase